MPFQIFTNFLLNHYSRAKESPSYLCTVLLLYQ
nr:MAG TPA: hypothetical protein [Caudoviricetes sp.]